MPPIDDLQQRLRAIDPDIPAPEMNQLRATTRRAIARSESCSASDCGSRMTGRNNPHTAGDIRPPISFNRSGEREPACAGFHPAGRSIVPSVSRGRLSAKSATSAPTATATKPTLTKPHAEQQSSAARIAVSVGGVNAGSGVRREIRCGAVGIVSDDVFVTARPCRAAAGWDTATRPRWSAMPATAAGKVSPAQPATAHSGSKRGFCRGSENQR